MIIKEGKTDWEFLLIALILAAMAGTGIFVFSRDITRETASLYNLPEIKWLKETVKSETDDWKIYENQDYGFQIKYPEDWNYGHNILRNQQEPHLVFCPPELVDTESDLGCKWYSRVAGNVITFDTQSPILLFVEDWDIFKGETKEEKKNTAWCESEEKKTINNIEMEFIDCEGQKRVYWEDPEGAHLYKLFLANSEFSAEFHQILSTFRFL